MQIDLFALRILLPMHVLEQVAGHQVFKPHALIALHQAGVEKIEFGRLQGGPRNAVMLGAQEEINVERLQDFR